MGWVARDGREGKGRSRYQADNADEPMAWHGIAWEGQDDRQVVRASEIW